MREVQGSLVVGEQINTDGIILNILMPSQNISIHSQWCGGNFDADADRCLSVHVKFRQKSSFVWKKKRPASLTWSI